jgi:hypothetical protein
MNMKRLNVFRRLDELETANMHLQVVLKSARADIKTLQAETRNLTLGVLRVDKEAQPAPAAQPTPKERKPYITEAKRKKSREYARKYYAKKKAEKLAVKP